jgi:S1-C subfamily serine protease
MKTIIALIFLISFCAQGTTILAQDQSRFLQDEKNSIDIFKKNAASVVNVSNIKVARNFWQERVEIPSGAGTGFVWDELGHIVTNYHVVAGGNSFIVTFHQDQTQYEATIIGADPTKDIAVLKLKKYPNKLTAITPSESSNLQVGQKAVAIGNPFGLDHTMTSGIISALDRSIDGVGGVKIRGMIQTDASINPGNSGGPLVNSEGNLIGMNTLIFGSVGQSAGVGFAVPVNTISRIVPQLIKFGKIVRPGLGIGLLPENYNSHFGIERGVAITFIDESGSAAKAGLKGITQDRFGRYYIGDIILQIEDKDVNSKDDLFQILDTKKVGDEIDVTYKRGKKNINIKIKLNQLSN